MFCRVTAFFKSVWSLLSSAWLWGPGFIWLSSSRHGLGACSRAVKAWYSGSWVKPFQRFAEVTWVLFHLLKHDAYHLDQTSFGCILIYLVGTCDVDVVEWTHHFQQTSLVDFSSARGYNCQESPNNLELDLLVTLCGALIHFIYNCIDKSSG